MATFSVYDLKIDNEIRFPSGVTGGYVLSINADGTTSWVPSADGGMTVDFIASTTSTTPDTSITFTDLSDGATFWIWSFGDGGTSYSQNPSYIYNAEGTFSVTLKAGNTASGGITVKTNYIVTTWGPFSASGGTTASYTEGGFTYIAHTFTQSGTFSVTGNAKLMDYLLVGGGGSSLNSVHTGGGGAGGFLLGTFSVAAGNYPVVVGAGGSVSPGGNTTFNSATAFGGGGGATYNGGSGAAAHTSSATRGLGTAGQGNAGGFGVNWDSGGGGGASFTSGTGSNGTAAKGGDGGVGRTSSYSTGATVWYSGGGGGGVDTSTTSGGGLGGTGGGGTGGRNNVNPGSGQTNTGGGGGGIGVGTSTGGSGGSGIAIIRYKI